MASVSELVNLNTQKIVLLVSGPTCIGKTTAIDLAIANENNNAMGCFIGREMRKRHPPEYFDGAMASEKTESEVHAIFNDVYGDFLLSDRTFLLCDGIPRLPSQVRFLHDTLSSGPRIACVAMVRFTLSDAERRERMRQRGGSASEQALAEARFHKDVEMLKPVYAEVENVCKDWELFELPADGHPALVNLRLEMLMGLLRTSDGSP